MSGLYKTKFSYTGNGTPDLLEVTAHSSKVLGLVGIKMWNKSDFGDAQEEVLSIIFSTGHTTSGSGGSAVTPQPLQTNGPAAGFVAEHQNSTPASGGTIVERGAWGLNVRSPLDKMLSELEQIWLVPGERGILKLNDAAADSITWEGECIWQEIG